MKLRGLLKFRRRTVGLCHPATSTGGGSAVTVAKPILLAAIGTMAAALAAQGQTLSVDPGAAGCDDAAGAPYCGIQAAVRAAPAGATVLLAAGRYDLWEESIQISRNLTLRGAGPQATVLDGGGQGASALVEITAEASNVGLESLSLVDRLRAGAARLGAGGIDHAGGRLTLRDVVLSGHQGGAGGALRVRSAGAEVRLERVSLHDNVAMAGAGINFRDAPLATLDVLDSTIRDNEAIFTGGGLFLGDTGPVSLERVVVVGNRSGSRGAGIYVLGLGEGGRLDLHETRVDGNASRGAAGLDAAGAGVVVRLHRVTLEANVSERLADSADCFADEGAVVRVVEGPVRVERGAACGL
jgi:hypothetical protein